MKVVSATSARFANENKEVSKNATSLAYATDAEWRTARRSGLGGSDIAAILGLNPYETRESVARSKLAEINRVATAPMIEGVQLEPLVVSEFAKTPQAAQFERIERNKRMFRRNDAPYCIATPDAFLIVGDEKEYGILECKTTVHRWTDQKLLMATLQTNWYCYVTGAAFGYVAALERREKLHVEAVLRDESLILEMAEKAAKFWDELQRGKHGKN